jgi:ferritin
MLSKTMEKALNEQIREEYYSSYLYLAMSAKLESANMHGMAHWMRLQAQEEMVHALKIFDHVHERGGTVTLLAIDQPKGNWSTGLAAFEAAYKHEQHITKAINTLLDKAVAEKDHATANFLQWFVKEQVEEEANVEPIVRRLELVGDNLAALFVLDHELGARG